MAEAGIGYTHLNELAPTTELRQLQYREDARLGEGKRSRTVLAPEYVRLYAEEILDRVDLGPILRWVGASRAALLCVERDPEACHRSLIAARLAHDWGFGSSTCDRRAHGECRLSRRRAGQRSSSRHATLIGGHVAGWSRPLTHGSTATA